MTYCFKIAYPLLSNALAKMLLTSKSAVKFITFYVAIMICLKGNACLHTYKCLQPVLVFVFNLFSGVKRDVNKNAIHMKKYKE